MPILEAKLISTYQGQICVNSFNYLASGTPAAVTFSFGLASAMGFVPAGPTFTASTLASSIQVIQNPGVEYVLLSVRDIYSDVDFYEVPFVSGTNGESTGTGQMSPFAAFGFRTNRTRLDIRRGQRRFAGVWESQTDDGGAFTASVLSGGLANLATKMSEGLSYLDEGNNLTYQPVIVSKERLEPDPPEYPNVRYKKYPTEAEQLQHIMTSIIWTAQPYLTTQNSRKRGRGT